MLDTGKRLAIVTGAASGIGYAIADRLAQDGFAVHLLDMSGTVKSAAEELSRQGFDVSSAVLDVSEEAAVGEAIDRLVSEVGMPSVLVNNAGVHPMPPNDSFAIEDLDVAEWRRTLDVNLTGSFLMSRAVIPHMRAGGWGRIINVSSRAGRTGVAVSGAHYAASKAGMIGLTRAVAVQCAKAGITVNAIAPGRIDTPMTGRVSESAQVAAIKRIPVGRAGTVREIAATAAFLASEDAGFITGAVIDANGGAFMA